MKSIICTLVAIAFTLGLTSAVLAQEEATDKSLPIPLTMKDLSGKSNVEFSLAMLPGTEAEDAYFEIAPMVSFRFAFGDLSLGLAVPMAIFIPDKGAEVYLHNCFVLGNPTIDLLYRHCTQGQLSLCFGGGLGIGVGGFASSDNGQVYAQYIGIVAHEDWQYHYTESFTLSPILVAGLSYGILVAQAEVGSTIIIPLRDTVGRSTEASFNFALGGGVKLLNFLIPLIEFRSIVPFQGREYGLNDTNPIGGILLWLSFGVRLQLGGFSPMFRLSVPLNDLSRLDAPVHLEVGLAYQF